MAEFRSDMGSASSASSSMVEQRAFNPLVQGSSPWGRTRSNGDLGPETFCGPERRPIEVGPRANNVPSATDTPKTANPPSTFIHSLGKTPFPGLGSIFYEEGTKIYVKTLCQTISTLRKATMIDMARSLVEIQDLRQMTTAEISTVGGPIDNADIARSREFRWAQYEQV